MQAFVADSNKAYGLIMEALPADIRMLFSGANLPHGYAYGVWTWLREKYQSNEIHAVYSLLQDWQELSMQEDEVFDMWRARVNKVNAQLDAVGEKPSDRVYAFVLIHKLPKRYADVKLNLLGGAYLKASPVDWEAVTKLINNHEKSVDLTENDSRFAAYTSGGGKHAPARAGSKPGKKRSKKGECWDCHEVGHFRGDPECKGQREGSSSAHSTMGAAHPPGGSGGRSNSSTDGCDR